MTSSELIQTGVDQLVDLVKRSGRMSFQDAAKELGVSVDVVKEWAEFLDEEGVIGIEYKLTKPYIVEKKLTKRELETKAKEFASKKDIFVRKAEGALGFLQKEAENLRKTKAEFDKMKKELGMELDVVKEELQELERIEKLKHEVSEQMKKEKFHGEKQLHELDVLLNKEEKEYNEIIKQIDLEHSELEAEKKSVKGLEAKEKNMKVEIDQMTKTLRQMYTQLDKEQEVIGTTQKKIDKLEQIASQLKLRMEKDKDLIHPLQKEKVEYEKNMKALQEQITKKLEQQKLQSASHKKVSERFKNFFNTKMKVSTLIDKLATDRQALEKELSLLVKKAKAFQLTTKKKGVEKEIAELERMFKSIDQKKSVFESEFKKLLGFVKS